MNDDIRCVLNGIKPLSPEQEDLIHNLVYFQNEYEHKNLACDHEDPRDLRYRHITDITILSVQLFIDFATKLPGFEKLLRDDQIVLLKACLGEVMMLRMARRYDVQTDSILFGENQPYTRELYTMAGMDEIIDDLLMFGRQMCSMKVDYAEYALLTAIIIFSEAQPGRRMES